MRKKKKKMRKVYEGINMKKFLTRKTSYEIRAIVSGKSSDDVLQKLKVEYGKILKNPSEFIVSDDDDDWELDEKDCKFLSKKFKLSKQCIQVLWDNNGGFLPKNFISDGYNSVDTGSIKWVGAEVADMVSEGNDISEFIIVINGKEVKPKIEIEF